MTKKAVLAAMLLILLLMLSGCFSQIQERETTDLSDDPIDAGIPAPQADGAQEESFYATLYYLGEDAAALVPVTRLVTARGVCRAEAALDALLQGPQEGENVYWPMLGDVNSTRFLEISGGVATVDLPAHARTLSQVTLYALRQAICNTLTEYPEISYVNVLVGGREEGFDLGATMPAGTLTRVDTDKSSAVYSSLDERRLSGGVTLAATLYFPSRDGSMILPQVRSVTLTHVSAIECLYMMLQELGKGANHELAAEHVPAPMDYIEEMPEIIRTEDGYLAIELRLSGELDDALEQSGLSRGIYLAMITDTLMGFVPGVEGICVSIDGVMITALKAEQTPDGEAVFFENGRCVRSDFAGYVGAPVTLYAVEEESGNLVGLSRPVAQAQAYDLRTRLLALMRLEGETYFALPSGLTEADILAVYVGGDTIAVNLSGNFADALSKLEEAEERAAVYAMVNTLTEERKTARVVFFFDGEQMKELAGALEMRGAFMRNPGMVVNQGGSMGIL